MISIQNSRTTLRLGSAGLALAMGLLSAPAFAQDAAATPAPTVTGQGIAAAEEEVGETIIVTGSRIARPDLDTTSPVAVLGAEEFALSGAVNVEDVLNDLPQLYPSLTAASNNPGDGSALADLRGLGAARTLVLVNGRRYVSYETTQLVDLNTIPAGLIKRVDVLTGGAGAVYGSDAIAGVINFVLDDEFEGAKVNATYRLTEDGDGGTFNTYGLIGGNFAGGRGNATVYVDYTKRKPIFQADRPFSSFTLSDDGEGGTFLGGSGSVPGTGAFIGAFNGTIPGLSSTQRILFQPDGSFRPYNGATDAFNFAPDNYLQVPQERFLINATGKYEINENIELYTELTFINNRVDTQLASTPITGLFRVPVNSPFFSSSTRAAFTAADVQQTAPITANGLTDAVNDGFVTLSIGRRLNEVGPRISQNDRNSYRVLTGARGEITGDFRYDGYYSYARTRAIELQSGNVSRSRFVQALNTVGTTPGTVDCLPTAAAGCAPINIFGAGNISPAGAGFITIDTTNTTVIESEVANFAVSNGNLFELGMGGGPVGFLVGVEWRRESGDFRPDFSLSSGDVVGFNAGTPTTGGYTTTDVFGELVVPIIADQPGFQLLEVNGAARYSDYSNQVGSAFAWAAGAKWKPIDDLTIRGQFQRAVRAPTVSALFLGQSEGFPQVVDYCRQSVAVTNATLRASCIANGVPSGVVGTAFGSGSSQRRTIFGGNPNLEEETSDTYTVGAILQPSFVPGLSLTVDYYNVKVENAILAAGPGATNVRDACFGTPDNGFTPFDPTFCSLIPRDPISFEIDGLLNTNLNAGFFETEGVDFSINYNTTLGFGLFGNEESRFGIRLNGTRLINFDFNNLAVIPDLINSCEGRFGATCGDPYAKWRGSVRTTFTTGPASFSLLYRYIDSVSDDGTAGTVAVDRVSAEHYFDIAVNFEVLKGFNLTVGVDNVGDNKPPLIGDANNQQANTFPSTYDVYGRRYFVSASATF